MHIIARNPATPATAFAGLHDGTTIHGITNGDWSMTDAIIELLTAHTGPSDLIIATWTAGAADIKRSEQLLRTAEVSSCRFLVDRSFQTRQPRYCLLLREAFGDEAVRVWSAHAKFVILTGGRFDVLYLTSANLNQGRRIENFSIFAGGPLPREYLSLVAEMWAAQKPGEAFEVPALAERQQKQVLARPATPSLFSPAEQKRLAKLTASIS